MSKPNVINANYAWTPPWSGPAVLHKQYDMGAPWKEMDSPYSYASHRVALEETLKEAAK